MVVLALDRKGVGVNRISVSSVRVESIDPLDLLEVSDPSVPAVLGSERSRLCMWKSSSRGNNRGRLLNFICNKSWCRARAMESPTGRGWPLFERDIMMVI